MILKANEKEYTIIPKIKSIIELTKALNGKNLNEVFFKGSASSDINTLCMVLEKFTFEDDKKAFKNIDEVYEFLDTYIAESGKGIADIYKDLAVEINNMGFFNKKMSMEELEMTLTSNLDINMDAIVTDIVKKVSEEQMKPVIEQEFKGFKA